MSALNSGGFRIIGERRPREDAMEQVTGRVRYAADLSFPNMLWARFLRSPHAHARIKRLDVSRALAHPGVKAVITGEDVPITFGILPVSHDEHAVAHEKVRYVGDPVAAVAAVDEATAEAACKLIEVEYEPLPEYMSVEEALTKPGDPVQEYTRKGNVHKAVALEFGEVEKGFAEADHVREDLIYHGASTHAPIEPHAAIGVPDGKGRVAVYASTQTPHYLHRMLAKVLGLPMAQVRVVAQPVGGGFGGKSEPFNHEIVAAKLALITGQPVKFVLTREEVFYAHRGRHGTLMWVKTGVKNDGSITAMHFRSWLDGGAHASFGLATLYYTGALQTSTYMIPNYKFEGARFWTNKPPSGPKRGHGTPQPRLALEIHMDKIAGDLGIDPADLRLKNAVEPNSVTANYLKITSCGLKECIERVVEASGYREKRGRLPAGKGVGLAVGAYLCGAGLPIYWNELDHSQAIVKADRGGGVTAYIGASEIGQGSYTVHLAIIAEVLGLEMNDIYLAAADTALTPIDLGSYSSRVTFMSGNAALQAAMGLRDMIASAVAGKLAVPAERMVFAGRRVYDRENSERGMEFAEACEVAEARHGVLVSTGGYKPPKQGGPFKGSGVGPSPAFSYSAVVAEVDADPETCLVKVEKVWVAHDIGRALNPMLVEGQVEGSVYMGIGEALMEEMTYRGTLVKAPSLLEYKIPTSLEMPEVVTILVESDEQAGPFGAKEAGQGPILPVIPATVVAIHDALGVRIDEVPATPDKVLKALDDKAAGGAGRVGPSKAPDFKYPEPERVPLPWTAGNKAAAGGER